MKKGKLVEILTGDGKGIFSPKESYTIKLWEDNAFFAKA
jgi:hypothetical protein